MTTYSSSTDVTAVNDTPCSVSLGFDILVSVMHWIKKREDLYSFVVTCADLYRTGIPILLGFQYRITPKNLASFHAFLTAKAPSSFLGLRDLDFCFPEWSMSVKRDVVEFDAIADIMNRAERLRHIRIKGSIEHQHPAAYQALATLPALRSLDLDYCEDPNNEQHAVLARLRSPLTNIKIQTTVEDGDIVAALYNFRHTLERVIVSAVSVCRAAPADFSYPNLTYLELGSMSHMQLSVLVPAFPNLKHLTVKHTQAYEETELLRTNNQQFQQDHPKQVWRLSSLSGAVGALYVLGLQTMVPVVTITSFVTFSERQVIQFRTVMTQLHPLMLSVEGTGQPIRELDWLSIVITDTYRGLLRLDLELTFEDSEFIEEDLVSCYSISHCSKSVLLLNI